LSALVPNSGNGKPQNRKTAVTYYRISNEKQDSLPAQRAWAQRVTQAAGLSIVAEFEDEGISGADHERPGLLALLEFVEKQFYAEDIVQALAVLDLDRLSRRDSLSTSALLQSLAKHGLRYIHTTSKLFDLRSPLDRTLIALGSDFTREPELRAKSLHSLNGMAEEARKGLWMGGPVPYGYRLDTDRRQHSEKKKGCPLKLGPDEEVETVRWIFTTYASGRLTANGIARELNARGIKPRAAGLWSPNTILKMLTNRVYLGAIVWGEQLVGRYHRLQNGVVVPREDKEDREQVRLRRRLKHLPVSPAGEKDVIVAPDAHPAIVDRALFDACAAQRERNREDKSAPRCGLKGNVWPLAGQLVCGHCGEPVWTIPVSDDGGKRKGTYRERARVCCSGRRRDPGACTASAMTSYLDVLDRVVALLREQLADPGAVKEMERELARQLREHTRALTRDRPRLAAKVKELDDKIARAVAKLADIPADLQGDVVEHIRSLKDERDALGQEVRDLDVRQREEAPINPVEFKATLQMVRGLTATMETREEAELLRAALKDLVKEVRVFFRPRRKSDPKPPRGIAPKRVLGRVEVDLTPCFADLLTMGSRRR
jgi:DNA invertase Pin-like site-specific DNA recombinase